MTLAEISNIEDDKPLYCVVTEKNSTSQLYTVGLSERAEKDSAGFVGSKENK